MKVEGPLGKARDVFENLIGGFRPTKGFRVGVMCGDEFANRGFERGDTSVDPSAQLFVREFSKPAFDEIEP